MKEEFSKIQGFEDYYDVSSNGYVRRIKYYDNGNKSKRTLPYILKPELDKDGYEKVSLSRENKYTRFSVHRLVALAFIPNPNNYPCVNHIDGNKRNNAVENLEWCTVRDNNIHSIQTGLKDMTKYSWKTSKNVLQYDLNMNLIAKYKSSGEAARQTNSDSGHIRACCRGEYKKHNGFIWKYESK